MVVLSITYGTSLFNLVFAMMITISGAAFMIAAGIGGTMAPFGDIAGSAFAMISFYKFLFAALMGSIVMLMPTTSAIPLGITMSMLGISCCSICLIYRHQLTLTEDLQEKQGMSWQHTLKT